MSSIGIDAVSTRPVGLHYYPSGLRRYVSRLGLNMAKRAFLTAQALRCEQLNELGLFEQLLAPDEFDAALGAWTQRLAQLALLAVQATKQSLNEIAAGHFDESTLRAPRVGRAHDGGAWSVRLCAKRDRRLETTRSDRAGLSVTSPASPRPPRKRA